MYIHIWYVYNASPLDEAMTVKRQWTETEGTYVQNGDISIYIKFYCKGQKGFHHSPLNTHPIVGGPSLFEM